MSSAEAFCSSTAKEEAEIQPREDRLLITAPDKTPRQGWDQHFKNAIAAGHLPGSEMLEGFSNPFEKDQWHW